MYLVWPSGLFLLGIMHPMYLSDVSYYILYYGTLKYKSLSYPSKLILEGEGVRRATPLSQHSQPGKLHDRARSTVNKGKCLLPSR